MCRERCEWLCDRSNKIIDEFIYQISESARFPHQDTLNLSCCCLFDAQFPLSSPSGTSWFLLSHRRTATVVVVIIPGKSLQLEHYCRQQSGWWNLVACPFLHNTWLTNAYLSFRCFRSGFCSSADKTFKQEFNCSSLMSMFTQYTHSHTKWWAFVSSMTSDGRRAANLENDNVQVSLTRICITHICSPYSCWHQTSSIKLLLWSRFWTLA